MSLKKKDVAIKTQGRRGVGNDKRNATPMSSRQKNLEIDQLVQTVVELQAELEARSRDAASLMQALEYEQAARVEAENSLKLKIQALQILEEENIILREEIQAYQKRPVHARKITRSRRSLLDAGFDFALDDSEVDNKDSFERRSSIVQRILDDENKRVSTSIFHRLSGLSDRLSGLSTYSDPESKDVPFLLSYAQKNKEDIPPSTSTSKKVGDTTNTPSLSKKGKKVKTSTTKKKSTLGEWNASVARLFPF